MAEQASARPPPAPSLLVRAAVATLPALYVAVAAAGRLALAVICVTLLAGYLARELAPNDPQLTADAAAAAERERRLLAAREGRTMATATATETTHASRLPRSFLLEVPPVALILVSVGLNVLMGVAILGAMLGLGAPWLSTIPVPLFTALHLFVAALCIDACVAGTWAHNTFGAAAGDHPALPLFRTLMFTAFPTLLEATTSPWLLLPLSAALFLAFSSSASDLRHNALPFRMMMQPVPQEHEQHHHQHLEDPYVFYTLGTVHGLSLPPGDDAVLEWLLNAETELLLTALTVATPVLGLVFGSSWSFQAFLPQALLLVAISSLFTLRARCTAWFRRSSEIKGSLLPLLSVQVVDSTAAPFVAADTSAIGSAAAAQQPQQPDQRYALENYPRWATALLALLVAALGLVYMEGAASSASSASPMTFPLHAAAVGLPATVLATFVTTLVQQNQRKLMLSFPFWPPAFAFLVAVFGFYVPLAWMLSWSMMQCLVGVASALAAATHLHSSSAPAYAAFASGNIVCAMLVFYHSHQEDGNFLSGHLLGRAGGTFLVVFSAHMLPLTSKLVSRHTYGLLISLLAIGLLHIHHASWHAREPQSSISGVIFLTSAAGFEFARHSSRDMTPSTVALALATFFSHVGLLWEWDITAIYTLACLLWIVFYPFCASSGGVDEKTHKVEGMHRLDILPQAPAKWSISASALLSFSSTSSKSERIAFTMLASGLFVLVTSWTLWGTASIVPRLVFLMTHNPMPRADFALWAITVLALVMLPASYILLQDSPRGLTIRRANAIILVVGLASLGFYSPFASRTSTESGNVDNGIKLDIFTFTNSIIGSSVALIWLVGLAVAVIVTRSRLAPPIHASWSPRLLVLALVLGTSFSFFWVGSFAALATSVRGLCVLISSLSISLGVVCNGGWFKAFGLALAILASGVFAFVGFEAADTLVFAVFLSASALDLREWHALSSPGAVGGDRSASMLVTSASAVSSLMAFYFTVAQGLSLSLTALPAALPLLIIHLTPPGGGSSSLFHRARTFTAVLGCALSIGAVVDIQGWVHEHPRTRLWRIILEIALLFAPLPAWVVTVHAQFSLKMIPRRGFNALPAAALPFLLSKVGLSRAWSVHGMLVCGVLALLEVRGNTGPL